MAAQRIHSSSSSIDFGHDDDDGTVSSFDQLSSCLSINILPDSILQFIGEYLPTSSRAMMASAVSRSACFDSDTLDFSDIDRDLASKLTDSDMSSILVSIDAVNRLRVLKIIGCTNISGVGLDPLRGSTVLEHMDLTTSFIETIVSDDDLFSSNTSNLSEDAVIPMLDSIIAKKDRALKLLELPVVWKMKKSKPLAAFMERYNNAQSSRACSCCECSVDFQACLWMNHCKGGPDWGLQRHTCYDCTENICIDCEGAFCDECKKSFCDNCSPMQYCECGKASCMDCLGVEFCESCNDTFCTECRPVCLCEYCNRNRCMDCSIHLFCSHCSKSNCIQCANEDNVEWCEVCEEDNCNDCRYEALKDGRLDCKGCRGMLLPRMIQENEAQQREIEMLKFVVLNAVSREIAQDNSKLVNGCVVV